MSGCNSCTVTPQGGTTPTNSSAVTYDGSALPCIPFSAGTLNAALTAIDEALCTLQAAIAALDTIDADNVTLDNLDLTCLDIPPDASLTYALNSIQDEICNLQTAISELDTDAIVTDGILANCAGITDAMTLTTALNTLLTYLCDLFANIQNGDVVMSRDEQYNTYKAPVNDYVKSTMTCTDTSGGGVAKVTFGALDYFVDNTNVSKPSEQIALADSADNYIFLDNTNAFEYEIASVAIGAAAPTTTGVDVVKVRTGTGTVTSITTLVNRYPIGSDLLADNVILARHLANAAVGIALELNSITNAIDVKFDNSTIGVNGSNELYVKADGITKTQINANVAGTGLGQNVDGSLEVNVAKSIEISSDAVQLVNDEASPGNYKLYGTDGTGAKGWNAQPKIYKAFLDQSSTNAPVATEFINTIGAIVWGYTSTGVYSATLASAFPAAKTFIMSSDLRHDGSGIVGYISAGRINDNVIAVNTFDGISPSTPSDDVLDSTNSYIYIEVFP